MSHELRIIPTAPDKFLLYCTDGDFTWHADETGEDCQLDLGRHEYRQHLAPAEDTGTVGWGKRTD